MGEALSVFEEGSTQQTLRAEIMIVGLGLVTGGVGGSGTLESLREELSEKNWLY